MTRAIRKSIAMFLVFLLLPIVNGGAVLNAETVSPTVADGVLRTVNVATVDELRTAMRNAIAGDEIVLASGDFDVTGLSGTRAGIIQARERHGTQANPITLRSADPENPSRIFSNNIQSGMIVHIWDGDFWIIRDLEIQGGQKGIMLDNSNHSVIRNNFVHSMGMEAIHLRDGSSFCQVIFNRVENTGLFRPGFGEGIYIGSAASTTGYCYYTDFNYIAFNVLGPGIAGEPIDVKEFTTGNLIEHNIMHGTGIHGRNTPGEVAASSFVAVKGNDTIIRYNRFYRENNTGMRAGVEVHSVQPGWGYRTIVYGNIFDLGSPASWGPNPTATDIWSFNPSNPHWPTNATHPVFAVGVWSGSAYVGDNTIVEPAVRGSLQQLHAMSGGDITLNLPASYTGPDPRVPIYTPPEPQADNPARNAELQLQTIRVYPFEWTTQDWGAWSGTQLAPNPSWTTLTIQCYLENGRLEFDVRHLESGNQNFSIGLKSHRHGRIATLFWNAQTAGRPLTATPEWQSFSLSIRDLYDYPNHPAAVREFFSLNDFWYIEVTGINLSTGGLLQFRDVRITSPDDERQHPFIKINQVGYEIGRPKPAIVSYFAKFGSLDGREFQVINADTGAVAYTGNLGTAILDPFEGGGGRSWSGEMLHHIYFCNLNTAGRFFIRIPNAGLNAAARSPRDIAEGLDVNTIESPVFTIRRNVYEDLLVDVIRYFFFQRQGLELEERYAGDFARQNLHPNDVAVRLWSDRNNPNPDPRNIYDVSKGWYDAGDYGKYIVPSTTTVSDLLWAYELFPSVFADLDLNIPEQNPANPRFIDAPGVLSELRWQLDKMIRFEHHSRDGSFFIAANYCGDNIIWIEDTLNRWTDHNSPAHERDLRSHHATANMAAVLAHAYLVYRNYPMFESRRPEYDTFAEEMLSAALRAWGWVTNPANPRHRHIDAANRVYGFTDDELYRSMFWAAGALYRAVGASGGDTSPFRTYLQSEFENPYVTRAFDGWQSVSYTHGGMGLKGFVHYLRGNPAPTVAIRDRFMAPNGFYNWRRIMERYHSNEWRITYPQWGLWWGSNQMIVQNSLAMLLGNVTEAQIRGEDALAERTIEHMEASLHYMLGLNPISFSYVSGHGERSVQNIFSAIFSHDARLEPYRIPPGYFTEGSNHVDNRHLSRFDGKCFVDSDGEWTTNENTIYHNAALTFLLAAIMYHTVGPCCMDGTCPECATPTYPVTVNAAVANYVNVSPTTAEVGDTITVTITPPEYFFLAENGVTATGVTDFFGNVLDSREVTFTKTAGATEVTAAFRQLHLIEILPLSNVNITHAQAIVGNWQLPLVAAIITAPENFALPNNLREISWNMLAPTPIFDPTTTTAQSITFTGTIELPPQVANPNNVSLTVSVTVNIAAPLPTLCEYCNAHPCECANINYITITQHPAASTTVTAGEITGELYVTATATEGAELSFQWEIHYLSDILRDFQPIIGATSAVMPITTNLTQGTHLFRVIVSAPNAQSVTSETATVIVNAPFTTHHTVTFDFAGGENRGGGESVQTVDPDSNATPPIAARRNYTFTGWFTQPNGAGTRWTAESVVTSDMTLYAAWQACSVPFQVGDVNRDGRVTSADATVMARYLAGQFDYAVASWLPIPICLIAADIGNSNQGVAIEDITLLARWLVGHNVGHLIR
ncbi:MAG: glycoside hydrolase family 9 protein [Defluviitaleaceae bacterium]|nr:glycoside hydrolase family 9 protein [Defluviitaleaceae bacterium]MCL2263475.1 glycoside hydrolase family 9 protein [Defluviitaleaceae bacterium]